MSLKTQKPPPFDALAWWVPPARLAATPCVSATRAAAMVAPTERRERSTISGDHGKPISRWRASSSRPSATSVT